jgi:hypothetical protein
MKNYKLEVSINENEHFCVRSQNDGMNAFELLGILEWKKQDIIKQMSGDIEPDSVTREIVEEEPNAQLQETLTKALVGSYAIYRSKYSQGGATVIKIAKVTVRDDDGFVRVISTNGNGYSLDILELI